MRIPLVLVPGIFALALGAACGDEPEPAPLTPKVEPKPADGDAPMPPGWPGATKPGRIEVKSYPAYRSAMARNRAESLDADDVLFFPLFRHIQKKGIEMTAPVVSTYPPAMFATPGAAGEMSMEFLYRTRDQGELGPGVGTVEVKDHPAARFVCLGIQGGMDEAKLRDAVKQLRSWLDEHKAEWVEDGPPRRLGYHGPMTREARRLWEVQIPVKAVVTPSTK